MDVLKAQSLCCVLTCLSADCEAGEDVVRARRERRAPPGPAVLGQGAVGGHVRSQAAHESARRAAVMDPNKRNNKKPEFLGFSPVRVIQRVCVFCFLCTLVCSHYACCFKPRAWK